MHRRVPFGKNFFRIMRSLFSGSADSSGISLLACRARRCASSRSLRRRYAKPARRYLRWRASAARTRIEARRRAFSFVMRLRVIRRQHDSPVVAVIRVVCSAKSPPRPANGALEDVIVSAITGDGGFVSVRIGHLYFWDSSLLRHLNTLQRLTPNSSATCLSVSPVSRSSLIRFQRGNARSVNEGRGVPFFSTAVAPHLPARI